MPWRQPELGKKLLEESIMKSGWYQIGAAEGEASAAASHARRQAEANRASRMAGCCIMSKRVVGQDSKQVSEAYPRLGIQGAREYHVFDCLSAAAAVWAHPVLAAEAQPSAGLLGAPVGAGAPLRQRLALAALAHRCQVGPGVERLVASRVPPRTSMT